ncbi:hypothetical protein ABVT39_002090 [Epinephelus coioides]
MRKLAAGSRRTVRMSAPVSLLDWYDLDQELILVLERPVPALDLLKYAKDNGGSLQEEEAKVPLPTALQSGTAAVPTRLAPMAVVLFEMLHRNTTFEMKKFLINELRISKGLPADTSLLSLVHIQMGHLHLSSSFPPDCQDFLRARLSTDPNQHPTPEELKRHSWLR